MFITAIYRYLKSAGSNFHEVERGRLYRAATPSPCSLARWQADFGIKTWIDLRIPSDYATNSTFFEDQCSSARRLGIKRISLPCSDKAPMSDWQIDVGLSLLTDKGKFPILFGCKGNRHRAGMLCAVYRMRVCGWSKEKAMEECYKCGYYPEGHREFDKRFMEVLNAIEAGGVS